MKKIQNKEQLVEIKKGQTGYGLLIENDGHITGKPGRSYRNINHGRICADRTGPCNRNDIVTAVSVSDTYHHSRKRIKHIACFPQLFFIFLHIILLQIYLQLQKIRKSKLNLFYVR